jgi:4-diphosphocytidyl-2-C-methyl-D-erythritol kinase
MHSYTLLAPAKINLYLEIVGDRPDGFHELVMVMQTVGLCDRITLRPNGLEEFRLFCNHPLVPQDSSNLAHRAATLMAKEFPRVFANYGGIDISIDKYIPVAAGLAGGSSNAAAVLVGIDLIWELGLTRPELETLAARLGSDTSFCVAGGTVICTGRGEILDPMPPLAGLWVILAKYDRLSVSTPWAYQTYRQQFASTYLSSPEEFHRRRQQVSSGALVQAIAHKHPRDIGKFIHNDLEKVVLPEFPLVAELRQVLGDLGGLGTMMSGSGPTVFTLCQSREEGEKIIKQAQTRLIAPDLNFWIAPIANTGIQLTLDS